MRLALAYDLLNHAIFLPSGGSGRLRQDLVDSLALAPRERVLELGCGTGQVTARLVAGGALVTAVDAHPEMLAAALRRAPTAHFLQGDVFDIGVEGRYDAVVLSFLLHNFGSDGRRRLLETCASNLVLGGRIAILEWALPAGRLRAAAWGRLLTVLEPSPAVLEVVGDGLSDDLATAGLELTDHRTVSLGRCQILVAGPSRGGCPKSGLDPSPIPP